MDQHTPTLRECLDQRILTQTWLSREAKLSMATVGRAFRGDPVSRMTRLKIERALDTQLSWPGPEPRTPKATEPAAVRGKSAASPSNDNPSKPELNA